MRDNYVFMLTKAPVSYPWDPLIIPPLPSPLIAQVIVFIAAAFLYNGYSFLYN